MSEEQSKVPQQFMEVSNCAKAYGPFSNPYIRFPLVASQTH